MRILYKWKRKGVCSRHFKADLKHNIYDYNRPLHIQKSFLRQINSSINNDVSRSTYSQAFFEKQRFKVYYGIPREKKFKKIAISLGTKNFIGFMESRLDILVWRLNFFDSLSYIRLLIKTGKVFVNNAREYNFERILRPGEEFSLSSDMYLFGFCNWVDKNLKNYKNNNPKQRFIIFNSYIEFSPSTGKFILVKTPDEKDVYIPFKYSSAFLADLYHPNMKINPKKRFIKLLSSSLQNHLK